LPTPSEQIAPDEEKMADLARQDLAARLGVPLTEISVTRVEAVQWRDGSLGCPEPGKVYIQVIIPGYRIVLTARGKEYVYHSDQTRRVITCAKRDEPL